MPPTHNNNNPLCKATEQLWLSWDIVGLHTAKDGIVAALASREVNRSLCWKHVTQEKNTLRKEGRQKTEHRIVCLYELCRFQWAQLSFSTLLIGYLVSLYSNQPLSTSVGSERKPSWWHRTQRQLRGRYGSSAPPWIYESAPVLLYPKPVPVETEKRRIDIQMGLKQMRTQHTKKLCKVHVRLAKYCILGVWMFWKSLCRLQVTAYAKSTFYTLYESMFMFTHTELEVYYFLFLHFAILLYPILSQSFWFSLSP